MPRSRISGQAKSEMGEKSQVKCYTCGENGHTDMKHRKESKMPMGKMQNPQMNWQGK